MAELQASAEPYLPKRMGIGVLNAKGEAETLLPNPEGKMLRYPVWVGARHTDGCSRR